jgi:hypothetical protein
MFLTLYGVVSSGDAPRSRRGPSRIRQWVHRYAVAFANLYREAFEPTTPADRRRGAEGVAALFDAAASGRTLVLQDVFLGVNAHVNHDLAYALVGVSIDPDRAQPLSRSCGGQRGPRRGDRTAPRRAGQPVCPGLTALDDCAGSSTRC